MSDKLLDKQDSAISGGGGGGHINYGATTDTVSEKPDLEQNKKQTSETKTDYDTGF